MKIAVFIDYWNFQLTLNQKLSKENNVEDYRAKIDWKGLGQTASDFFIATPLSRSIDFSNRFSVSD